MIDTAANAIWSFAAGAMDSLDDLSERFMLVTSRALSGELQDEEESSNDETGDQQKTRPQHRELFKRSQSRRWASRGINEDVPPSPPTRVDETPERSIWDEVSRRRYSSCYSNEWDEIRMTPRTLLSKMLPSEVEKAEQILLKRQQSTRYSLNKMTRLERQLQVQSSLRNLLDDDPSFHDTALKTLEGSSSTHTAVTSLTSESWDAGSTDHSTVDSQSNKTSEETNKPKRKSSTKVKKRKNRSSSLKGDKSASANASSRRSSKSSTKKKKIQEEEPKDEKSSSPSVSSRRLSKSSTKKKKKEESGTSKSSKKRPSKNKSNRSSKTA
mmetsp:Transcript_18462/g.45760  ORF Transcript_18462/g.45760 Transcript_18462/m.45760 type:complete len:326 (-) Transcript_18462:204-1181(-)